MDLLLHLLLGGRMSHAAALSPAGAQPLLRASRCAWLLPGHGRRAMGVGYRHNRHTKRDRLGERKDKKNIMGPHKETVDWGG